MLRQSHYHFYNHRIPYNHSFIISSRAGIDNHKIHPYHCHMDHTHTRDSVFRVFGAGRNTPLFFSFFMLFATPLFFSCGPRSNNVAIIWTNQGEFAAYAEVFNAEQEEFKIAVEYRGNPAEELRTSEDLPDIVIGPWIKGEKTRSKLVPLTYLFNERKLEGGIFYRPLLDLGNIRGEQFSLPVSFNIPALIFSREHSLLMPQSFVISFATIQSLSTNFNVSDGGVYSQMAFSPHWDPEFLYLTAQMMDANFHESANVFSWDEKNLRDALIFLTDWETDVNTSVRAAEDFQFKYLYDPPERLVTGGRILFYHVYTNDLFPGPQEKLQHIDFRWPAHNGQIPLKDEIIYLGICRKAKNRDAADAFVSWFFKEDTQMRLLQYSDATGITANSFGISNGFSAIKSVNEKVFPLYYPELLGRTPAENQLKIPLILPDNWEELKREIVAPFLSESTDGDAGEHSETLSSRIEAWRRNR